MNRDNIPYVLEVNTIPGMTETSLFPDAARAMGISFPDLVARLVNEAWRWPGKEPRMFGHEAEGNFGIPIVGKEPNDPNMKHPSSNFRRGRSCWQASCC